MRRTALGMCIGVLAAAGCGSSHDRDLSAATVKRVFADNKITLSKASFYRTEWGRNRPEIETTLPVGFMSAGRRPVSVLVFRSTGEATSECKAFRYKGIRCARNVAVMFFSPDDVKRLTPILDALNGE